MPHRARVVVPGLAHHVVQRGNRRQLVFFRDSDYQFYLGLLRNIASTRQVQVIAYCLMSNHVHLVLVPPAETALAEVMSELHRTYTRCINAREGWTGRLWQGPFFSCSLDDRHLLATLRYVECNPVHASMVERAGDYCWSSAKAHLKGATGGVLSHHPALDEVGDWAEFLNSGSDADFVSELRKSTRTGRPLGSTTFLADLEHRLGRRVRPSKRGRKRHPCRQSVSGGRLDARPASPAAVLVENKRN